LYITSVATGHFHYSWCEEKRHRQFFKFRVELDIMLKGLQDKRRKRDVFDRSLKYLFTGLGH